MCKKIPLSKGQFALVDEADFDWLNQWKWFYLNPGYAARSVRIGKKVIKILMHREITKAPKGMETDHINENKVDNRRINLRVCTKGQNNRNRGKLSTNTSGYKGVYWHKYSKKWTASIAYNGKKYFLGYFVDKKEAAKAYDKAALTMHKEYANINKKD